ncbi:MAG: Asp-tRNA(Asn)/Glu-tRNA(Gln) amidotransferase subunit GatB [Chlamydiales bacterium]|nr:Asp-tRNA(Asn)/Glu-tRNA(Gln) amidotransferase subunit GatB [Chlamydiia bacterium]MCP5508668.1 Asp-tRNA(Asn)/Glu-tRNA(Gln) amidotransferase subunit GatB [Chlamydiales bacterium]
MSHHNRWETIIGLEIHSELNTKSKLFSVAPNRFGDEPNTNITEVCTGQPGALPVLNKEAVRKAVQLGCALEADVQKFSKFDRKSYFYPDSPRNFQITQFDQPIILGGTVIAEVDGEEHAFAVNRVHLEDDAGMLKHFSTFGGVDYNRAGVPLVEIVSEPCIHSPQQAMAYAMAIKAILQYIDASDCNMEEGHLRFDANISVRLKGEQGFRNKIEIKNMNSFSNMGMALEAEIKRQIAAYESNPDMDPNDVIQQATYRWDPDRSETVLMRRKEEAMDYRYFPEPDLVPIILTDAYIEEIRAALPELPLQRERRYVSELALTPHNAFILTSDKPLADYFEIALQTCENARSLCNWLVIEFAGRLKESGKSIIDLGIKPDHVAHLVNMIDSGTITGKIAKSVADDMVANPGKDPQEIVKENPDYQPLNDQGEIESMVDKVLAENAQSVADFKAGKDRAFGFLVGQVMKLSRGKAAPEIVNQLLKDKIQ